MAEKAIFRNAQRSEAKAIGLNMKMRKQYEFTIYIEC